MDYDIIVIGGGPGGYVAAIKAAQEGKRVCLIEQSQIGGVCLNEGCIPTKAIMKSVDVYETVKNASKFAVEGVEAGNISVSMASVQKRKNMVVNRLVMGVKALLKNNNVHLIEGQASFMDKNTICVGEQTLAADFIIIATGSETFMPPSIVFEGENNVITSREALQLDYIPESVAIIGGGVIGVEFAYIFAALGSKVHVLKLSTQILPVVDEEIGALVRKKLERMGVSFYTGVNVTKVADNKVFCENQGEIQVDMVLISRGRTPNTEGLNAEGIGIVFDKKAIVTNDRLQTNVPNIYAIGDVNGKSMLAHTASHEGIVAVANICGHNKKMHYDAIASCIYIQPEVAAIGLTEKEAREKYENVKTGSFPLIANGKSLAEGESQGMIKVVVEGESRRVLGAHIFALHATDMIAEIAVAMGLGATAQDIIDAIHPHPTISEIIPEAFMSAVGKAIHGV